MLMSSGNTSFEHARRTQPTFNPPPPLLAAALIAQTLKHEHEHHEYYHNDDEVDMHRDHMHIDLRSAQSQDGGGLSTAMPGHPFVIPSLATPPVTKTKLSPPPLPTAGPVIWDWAIEHADRAREKAADAARAKHHGDRAGAGIDQAPFEVDRKVVKDIVGEKMAEDVGRILFIGSGTFNKAYLVTLVSGREVVMRVARRFMPRLKTSSEVATMHYLRTRSSIPVPDVYAHDSEPHNRLGAEYILMSKAPGVPLATVYNALSYQQLNKLMTNAAGLLIPLFGHRFDKIGSLYLEDSQSAFPSGAPSPMNLSTPRVASSSVATPRPGDSATPKMSYLGFATAPPLSAALSLLAAGKPPIPREPGTVVGPIVSWPFFGSHRGELTKTEDIDRGPFASTFDYLIGCAFREIRGVIRENEGKAAPHRISLDPDEIRSSRHHHLNAVPGDESDASTEWDMSESERAWDEPGDTMYQDYRRMQRSTFLVAQLAQREQAVGEEMERFIGVMEKLGVKAPGAAPEPVPASTGYGVGVGVGVGVGGGPAIEEPMEKEEFALDCHDLNLENIFVDEEDPTKITCIIDWECTTTRPLWAAAHLPAFVQSSPFTARMYRHAIARIASDANASVRNAALASQWLANEAGGARLRAAHRCVEWDGWEEGLVEGILGPVEDDGGWEQEAMLGDDVYSPMAADAYGLDAYGLDGIPSIEGVDGVEGLAAGLFGGGVSGLATGMVSPGPGLSRSRSPLGSGSGSGETSEPSSNPSTGHPHGKGTGTGNHIIGLEKLNALDTKDTIAVPRTIPGIPVPQGPKALVRPDERAKERELDSTGDLCGGRGGELGRRLEAWLYDVRGEEVGAEGEVIAP